GYVLTRARREEMPRHRTLGIERQPPPIDLRRLVDTIPSVEERPEAPIGLEMVRPEHDRLPVLGERFGHPLQRLVRLGEVDASVDHVRAQRDGPFIARGGLLEAL